MRRALAIDEASYGKDHPNVATDLNNLAQLLQATNRLGEAEPLMRRALAIDEASYGKDHPNVATRPQQPRPVAASHQPARRGGTADAPRAGHRRGQLRQRTIRTSRSDLNNLALLLQATNRLGEAEPLMRRALAIFLAFQRDTGHAHPHRDAAIANYRGLLAAMGKTEAEIDAAGLRRDTGREPTVNPPSGVQHVRRRRRHRRRATLSFGAGSMPALAVPRGLTRTGLHMGVRRGAACRFLKPPRQPGIRSAVAPERRIG